MPDEWRSILVSNYKNKGDIQSCTNYWGIKLMSHTMKLWESYRASLESSNVGLYEPIWFHARKVNHGSHFLNKTSYGAVQGEEGPTHVFIDLEKAYDKLSRNVMWWALDKHKVPTKYIELIKDMYNNVVTSVRTSDETRMTSRLG